MQQRASGTCWRCVAILTWKGGSEREGMRPVLDKAFIVEGLEEFSMDERRRRVENAGLCWFCGAHGGGVGCGTGKVDGKGSAEKEKDGSLTGAKRRMPEPDMEQGRNKILRVEHKGSSMPTPLSVVLTQSSVPQPLDPAFQQYDYNSGGFGYDQFNQPPPTLNYQSQKIPFLTATPQNKFGHWLDLHDFQEGTFGGGERTVQADPSLQQPQAGEELQQNVELPLRQNEEFPPVLDFGRDLVSPGPVPLL